MGRDPPPGAGFCPDVGAKGAARLLEGVHIISACGTTTGSTDTAARDIKFKKYFVLGFYNPKFASVIIFTKAAGKNISLWTCLGSSDEKPQLTFPRRSSDVTTAKQLQPEVMIPLTFHQRK